MRTPVGGAGPRQCLRPQQGLGAGATAAVDAGIPGPLRSQSRGSGGRRAGHRRNLYLRLARHAARDQWVPPVGIRGHAEHHAHPGREHPQLAADFHRRARLAGASSSRPSSAIRSANGSIPTATANTTCWRSRPAASLGPRAYDASGIPLHDDNQTIVKERLYLDKNDPNMLRDEVTVFDHALTRPWAVVKSYRRLTNPHGVGGGSLRRGQQPHPDRQRELHDQRRRQSDAHQEGTIASGPQIFLRGPGNSRAAGRSSGKQTRRCILNSEC